MAKGRGYGNGYDVTAGLMTIEYGRRYFVCSLDFSSDSWKALAIERHAVVFDASPTKQYSLSLSEVCHKECDHLLP